MPSQDYMQPEGNPYASFGTIAAKASVNERSAFIKKTYIHLGMAIYGFVAIEWAIFGLFDVPSLMQRFFNIPYATLIMFGGFIAVSFIADMWARSSASKGMQYAGLLLYVLAEAIIFVPMLYFANLYAIKSGQSIIMPAAIVTLVIFGGLTAIVFTTKADFSFLRVGLAIAGIAAFGLILFSAFSGFDLGIFFTVGMIVFASAYILYSTSNILHHYRTDQYVAASLALFAAVALLFWYVLQLFMSRD